MPAAVEAVREAFLDLAAGRFEVPQRLSFAEATTLVMAACHIPTSTTVVKTLNLSPGRTPMILGTLVWNTAEGQLVADAVEVTALRTGAVSGVATDLLAPPSASRLALLGTGAQAADQVRAVAAVRPLRRVSVFGRDRSRASVLADRLSAEFPSVAVRVARHAAEAVADAEVVCCATSSSTPLFSGDDLPERVHVNAIGSYLPSMRELPAELLGAAECVVVDQVDAALTEAGEVIHAVDSGLLGRAELVELGSALRRAPVVGGRTVFKSVGLAVQDWAVARLLGEAAGVRGRERAGRDGGAWRGDARFEVHWRGTGRTTRVPGPTTHAPQRTTRAPRGTTREPRWTTRVLAGTTLRRERGQPLPPGWLGGYWSCRSGGGEQWDRAERRNLAGGAFDRSPDPGIFATCLLGEPPPDGTRPCGSSRRSARSSRGSKFST